MLRPKATAAHSRLSLSIPTATRNRMERLRNTIEADSVTEVIRRALSAYDTLIEAIMVDGCEVIIRSGDGSEKVMVLP